MRKHLLSRILALVLAVVMVVGYFPTVSAVPAGIRFRESDIEVSLDRSVRLVEDTAEMEIIRKPTDLVRVSIVLEKESTLKAGFSTTDIAQNEAALNYNAALQREQETMAKTISRLALDGEKLDVVWNITLAGNIISANVPYGKLEDIASVDGVAKVVVEQQYVADPGQVVEPNTSTSAEMIGSTTVWQSGYTGAGSRVAIVDTGTDTDHQSFDNGAFLYALQQNAKAEGVSYESYVASLDLLDAAEIAAVLPNLNATERVGANAADYYISEKLPFGANYVDRNLTVSHDYDYQGSHGSHVAGIAAANRYIPDGNGYADARKTVLMSGVAPDAQILTMKVFGMADGPYDSDYFAAIEDAIWLGADSVNLSLGSSNPGTSYNDTFADLLEYLEQTDTVVVMSSGNSGHWAMATLFGYPYSDGVNFHTNGSPGSYTNSLTVASVDNDGTVGYYFDVKGTKAFYAETLGYGNTAMATLDTSSDGSGTEYTYIFLDGIGEEEEYAGIDVAGKVVMVSRGVLNFAAKANNALSRGAVAVVVYNNESGINNMDLTGLYYAAPVVSITQAVGQAIRAASENKSTYLTGKMTIYGTMGAGTSNSEYYTMSSFSSWGGPGNLSLKPEITAPGGKIWSVWGSNTVDGGGSDQYVTMSGTSMAAPQVAGMVALLAEYVRETGLDTRTGMSARHLAQSLLMSTAQPLREEASEGEYYSLLNQGAGLGRIDLATTAESYVLVEGMEDGKVKAELGEDPDRTGVYKFSFSIHNMNGQAMTYALSADMFTQDVFEYSEGSGVYMLDTWTRALQANTAFRMNGAPLASSGDGFRCDLNGDGATNSTDADYLLEYVLGNVSKLHANGDLNGDGNVNTYDAHLLLTRLSGGCSVEVPANGSVTIDVTMELSQQAKTFLDANYPAGAYIEAFVYAEPVANAEGVKGVTHSIPVLGFYGSWSESSMFELGSFLEMSGYATNLAPYLYRVYGAYYNYLTIDYGDGGEYYFGGNPYVDEDYYLPERNAFNNAGDDTLKNIYFTLIRNACAGRILLENKATGEIYYQNELDELGCAFYNTNYGVWMELEQEIRLGLGLKEIPEGTDLELTVIAAPELYRVYDVAKGGYTVDWDALKDGTRFTTEFTIDNTAPELLDVQIDANNNLTITAKDNEYVAAAALMNYNGTKIFNVAAANQSRQGEKVTISLDSTGAYGKRFLVSVMDYADNMTTYEVEMDLELERSYFTAIDYNSMNYVSMDMGGKVFMAADSGIPGTARAAEYVGGHVFAITDSNYLYATSDEDLSLSKEICNLDPAGEWMISGFNDLAYNYADGKLYGNFYSHLNNEEIPYLCTIDLENGTLDVLGQMPVDVNTMAIDGQGNFYSAGYNDSTLYTYRSDVCRSGSFRTVNTMGYYGTSSISSMAWDHNTDRLYWAYPNILLEINPQTAEPTLLGYQEEALVGLYTRPAESEGRFDPVDHVDRVELNFTDTRVAAGGAIALEAKVWPWYTSDDTVTWSSSNSAVATVDADGTVTGISEGTVTITATSNLDSGKRATCTVEVMQLRKTLNGLVWDEEGAIWMSEFSTNNLPNYTKLHTASLGNELASATISQNGTIYAASFDTDSMRSSLYKLDPVTYQPTLIGSSTDGYVDLAPAPSMPGNSLAAAYGGNVLLVDAVTGDYYTWYNMFRYDLVGLAYVGSQAYKEYGYDTMIDWYFIIDRIGTVYLLGLMEQNGNYYYLEAGSVAPGGLYTQIDFEMETPFFGSAYFDGEFLYFSAYKESENNVTLMAIDVAGGSKSCYTLGTFADGVWPVGGLMELDSGVESNLFFGTERTSQPMVCEPGVELTGLKASEAKPIGGIQNVTAGASGAELLSKAEMTENGSVTVDVTLPAAATNGVLTVTYDPAALKLTGVEGKLDVFASSASDGTVKLAFAAGAELSYGTEAATLSFVSRAVTEGTTTVTIAAGEWNDGRSNAAETVNVELPCPSERFMDVGPGVWYHEPVDYVVAKGYMNGMDGTHFGPDLTMTRAQFVTVLYRMEGEPATTNTGIFKDVPANDYYTKATYWALEAGITTGMDADHFGPGRQLTRAQLVTFMYRYAKYKGYDTSATASLDAYSDSYQVSEFARVPFSWALTHGIVTGVSADTLAPEGTATRAQAATIFMRLDKTFRGPENGEDMGDWA